MPLVYKKEYGKMSIVAEKYHNERKSRGVWKVLAVPVSVCRTTLLKPIHLQTQGLPCHRDKDIIHHYPTFKKQGAQIPLAAASKLCRNAY